jgi:hypothetical protein
VPSSIETLQIRWSFPGVAIGPEGNWVAMRFASGELALVDASGVLQWSAEVDVDRVEGTYVAFDVEYDPPSGSDIGCGTPDPVQAPHPHGSPDGSAVVASGSVGGGEDHLVQVWDADTGEVLRRFLFDAPAHVLGFRGDERLVVWAGDAVFALDLV